MPSVRRPGATAAVMQPRYRIKREPAKGDYCRAKARAEERLVTTKNCREGRSHEH